MTENDKALNNLDGIKNAFNDVVRQINVTAKSRTVASYIELVNTANEAGKRAGVHIALLRRAIDRAVITPSTEPVTPDAVDITVTLTSPLDGAVVTEGDTITVSATVSDIADTEKVELYCDDERIATVTIPTGGVYSTTHTPSAGVCRYRARAYDTLPNGFVDSSVATVTVNEQVDNLQVNVASLSRGAVATATSSYVGDGYSVNGAIDGLGGTAWAPAQSHVYPQTYQIDFHAGRGQLIEQITVGTWNPSFGIKDFRIEYLANSGWTTLQTFTNHTSATATPATPTRAAPIVMFGVRVVVTGSHDGFGRIHTIEAKTSAPVNTPPIVTITSPKTKTSYLDGDQIVMSVDVTDPDDDDIIKVEFIVNDGNGDEIVETLEAEPWTHTIASIGVGSKTLKFRAYDSAVSFTEKTVAITVSETPSAPVERPAWITAAPDTWGEIAGSAPANFNVQCRPAWNTDGSLTYKKNTFWNWNGIQVDVKRGIIYNFLSGGHFSTLEQNGGYKCDLNVSSPAWASQFASTQYTSGQAAATRATHFPDGRPVGRHTYSHGQVVDISGSPCIVFAYGSNTITNDGAVSNPRAECFRISRNDWDLNNTDPTDGVKWPLAPFSVNTGIVEAAAIATDYRNSRIWAYAQNSGIYFLEPGAKTWTHFTSANVGNCGGGACIDTKRNRFVIGHNQRVSNFSQSGPSGLTIVDLTGTTAGTVTNQLVTGAAATWTWGTGHAGQIVYDSVKDRYIHFNESTAATVAVDPETFAATALPSYTAVESPGTGDGPQGKFAYIPMWGVVIYLRGYNDNIRYMSVATPSTGGTVTSSDYVPLIDGLAQRGDGSWFASVASGADQNKAEGPDALYAHNRLTTGWENFGNYRDINKWKRQGGDWRDKNNLLHGSTAFGTATVPLSGIVNQAVRFGASSGAAGAAMAAGVQTQRTGVNHGWYIRVTSDSVHMTGPPAFCAGRSNASSSLHPKITCITVANPSGYVCSATANIGISSGGVPARQHNGTTVTELVAGDKHTFPLMLKFDYSSIPAGETVTHAYIDLTVVRSLAANLSYSAFLLEMPPLIKEPRRQFAQIGKTRRDTGGIIDELGGNEVTLRTLVDPSNTLLGYVHPDVLRVPRLTNSTAMRNEFEVTNGRTYTDSFATANNFNTLYHPITWDGNIEAVRCEIFPAFQGTAGYWGHLMFETLSESARRYSFQKVATTTAGLQEIYCRFGIKFHTNYKEGAVDGCKLSGPNGTHDISPYGNTSAHRFCDFNTNFYWQAHIKPPSGTLPGLWRMESYEYGGRNSPYDAGAGGMRGANPVWDCVLVENRITWIEMRMKLNTPIPSLHDQVMALPYTGGTEEPFATPKPPPQPDTLPIGISQRRYQHNGELQVWVDNVEVYYDHAVFIRNSPWCNILDFWWQFFHGGANSIIKPVTVESGGIALATRFIGMPYAYR